MNTNILITYKNPEENDKHIDPDFTNLVYGDSGNHGDMLKNNLKEGSFIFFNTSIGGSRYITAYFEVEKILLRGKDNAEIDALKSHAKSDEVIIIGKRGTSKILTSPLLFNKELAMKLPSLDADQDYFDEKFSKNQSELSSINYKTRTPRKLENEDKEILLQLCKFRG